MDFRELIVKNIHHNSDTLCCTIAGEPSTYNDLNQFLKIYSRSLKDISNSRIGIIIRNDFNTYAATISSILNGVTFVPINPDYPEQRITDIIEASDLNTCYDSLNLFQFEGVKLLNSNLDKETWELIGTDYSNFCYILFTSGTTGKPKGVPISYSNLQAFLNGFQNLGYNVSSEDRFLQMFELTFDLSVVSYIAPLLYGASFHTLDTSMVKPLALYDALDSQKITIALMVPSAIDMLMPYAEDIELPHLRLTQFCGEALKIRQVDSWKSCVPNTQIDNVYGPTEATIYCTRYTVPHDKDILHHNGIVCIGEAMSETFLEISIEGELCLGGGQVSPGYLHATDEQKSKFYLKNNIQFYFSGDNASIDNNLFYCHGRIDDQVKVQGFRVELAELEFACNSIFPTFENTAIAVDGNNGTELHLFLKTTHDENTLSKLQHNLKSLLPWYMVPHEIHWVDNFPLNANGKIDKKKLKQELSI